MTKLKYMTYTKDNGDISQREVVVVSAPRQNYLVYDVTKLSNEEVNILLEALDVAEEHRDSALKHFELLTGLKQSSLWRSFKPGGIEWDNEDT